MMKREWFSIGIHLGYVYEGSPIVVADGTPRPFDIPWIVLDSSKANRIWQWQPTSQTAAILEEISRHAEVAGGVPAYG